MALDVGGRIIADVRCQGVGLRPNVGSYELAFHLMVDIFPAESELEASVQASIIGAQVSVAKDRAKHSTSIGFARPHGPFEIVPKSHSTRNAPGLHLRLQPSEIAALESLRESGDLTFRLQMIGTGRAGQHVHQVDEDISVPVARSDWIEKLRDAGARNVMLLEVPLPLENASEEWQGVVGGLQRAEEQYFNGDYASCVGSCRLVMEELGNQSLLGQGWNGEALPRLTSDRKKMTKREREVALWAAAKHYADQAHHSGSKGGESEYFRSEAQFTLALAAAAVARVRAS